MINHPSNPGTASALLGRLRTAVGKVRLLLRSVAAPSPFSLVSLLRSSTAALRARRPQHRLSFKDRRPSGLLDVCSDVDSPVSEPCEAGSSNDQAQSSGSTPARVLHRTRSSPGSVWEREEADEEIDQKADMFITNFYRQLRLDKQVSLDLRYCRDYSFGSSPDPSPTFNLSLTSP